MIFLKRVALVVALTTVFAANAESFVDPETPEGALPENTCVAGSAWNLVFSDEFNGTAVDETKWSIDNSSSSRAARASIGIDTWYWRTANVEVADGRLILKVKKASSTSMHCGSVNSNNKFMFTYGYLESRIQIAEADKGTHTALWLQGQGMGTVDGTAYPGAEVDIFESAWLDDYTKSVIHIDGYGDYASANTVKYTTVGLHEGYHVWGFLWTANLMNIYYDGEFKVQYSGTWVPRADEYLWLSDGASFGLSGDEYFVDLEIGDLTEAYVDYIRVWQLDESAGNLVKNGDFLENVYTDDQVWLGDDMASGVVNFDTDDTAINAPSARMTGATASRYIYQDVDVESGEMYLFRATARTQNEIGSEGGANSGHTVKFEVASNSDDAVLSSLSTGAVYNTELAGVFTVPDGVTSVRVSVSKESGIAYFDDVSLTKVTDASDLPEVEVGSPKLAVDAESKVVTLSDLEASATVELVSASGATEVLTVSSNSVSYDFSSKSKGRYTFKITGTNSYSFVVNTNNID